jgi:hypothetical protein
MNPTSSASLSIPARKGKLIRIAAVAAAIVWLTGCASPDQLRVGMTSAQLDAQFGKPVAERREGNETVRIYTSQPFGETASAAHIAPDGRVVAIEPLLDLQHFATIRVDQWNKQDVLSHFGPPAEVRGTRQYSNVWSYRYRESNVWYSLFSVMFDDAGIVRQTQNGPDPMFDPADSHQK